MTVEEYTLQVALKVKEEGEKYNFNYMEVGSPSIDISNASVEISQENPFEGVKYSSDGAKIKVRHARALKNFEKTEVVQDNDTDPAKTTKNNYSIDGNLITANLSAVNEMAASVDGIAASKNSDTETFFHFDTSHNSNPRKYVPKAFEKLTEDQKAKDLIINHDKPETFADILADSISDAVDGLGDSLMKGLGDNLKDMVTGGGTNDLPVKTFNHVHFLEGNGNQQTDNMSEHINDDTTGHLEAGLLGSGDIILKRVSVNQLAQKFKMPDPTTNDDESSTFGRANALLLAALDPRNGKGVNEKEGSGAGIRLLKVREDGGIAGYKQSYGPDKPKGKTEYQKFGRTFPESMEGSVWNYSYLTVPGSNYNIGNFSETLTEIGVNGHAYTGAVGKLKINKTAFEAGEAGFTRPERYSSLDRVLSLLSRKDDPYKITTKKPKGSSGESESYQLGKDNSIKYYMRQFLPEASFIATNNGAIDDGSRTFNGAMSVSSSGDEKAANGLNPKGTNDNFIYTDSEDTNRTIFSSDLIGDTDPNQAEEVDPNGMPVSKSMLGAKMSGLFSNTYSGYSDHSGLQTHPKYIETHPAKIDSHSWKGEDEYSWDKIQNSKKGKEYEEYYSGHLTARALSIKAIEDNFDSPLEPIYLEYAANDTKGTIDIEKAQPSSEEESESKAGATADLLDDKAKGIVYYLAHDVSDWSDNQYAAWIEDSSGNPVKFYYGSDNITAISNATQSMIFSIEGVDIPLPQKQTITLDYYGRKMDKNVEGSTKVKQESVLNISSDQPLSVYQTLLHIFGQAQVSNIAGKHGDSLTTDEYTLKVALWSGGKIKKWVRTNMAAHERSAENASTATDLAMILPVITFEDIKFKNVDSIQLNPTQANKINHKVGFTFKEHYIKVLATPAAATG